MMKQQIYILSFIFFILGVIFFAIQKEFIIFRLPFKKIEIANFNKCHTSRKTITFYYYNNIKWITENIDILISENVEDNIQKIINTWLNLLDEEKIIEKISLQTALISENSNELYLSFDRNLVNEENSTMQKLMLIESLLRTLRDNDIKISKVNFLVHHQIMKDHHLDFSNPWPIEGFLKK